VPSGRTIQTRLMAVRAIKPQCAGIAVPVMTCRLVKEPAASALRRLSGGASTLPENMRDVRTPQHRLQSVVGLFALLASGPNATAQPARHFAQNQHKAGTKRPQAVLCLPVATHQSGMSAAKGCLYSARASLLRLAGPSASVRRITGMLSAVARSSDTRNITPKRPSKFCGRIACQKATRPVGRIMVFGMGQARRSNAEPHRQGFQRPIRGERTRLSCEWLDVDPSTNPPIRRGRRRTSPERDLPQECRE